MSKQFVSVRFGQWVRKVYTYHWEGELPLKPGETVRVDSREGDGWVAVTVHAVDLPQPEFATKPILGRVEQ